MQDESTGHQERSPFSAPPPLNVAVAESLLLDINRVLGGLRIPFFLRHGTALGAVRDHSVIPWDDDVDVGSIMGMHGLTAERVVEAAEALKSTGAEITLETRGKGFYVAMMREDTRLDWNCYEVENDTIVQHPGIPIPIEMFVDLKPVPFLGETFLVPNPPERYFELKYGPNWGTPTSAGFEREAVLNVPGPETWPWLRRLSYRVKALLAPRQATRIRVLDENGTSVRGARVTAAGQPSGTSNADGVARVRVPTLRSYAITVDFAGEAEVLYEERIGPGRAYTYRRDPANLAGRLFTLVEDAAS